MSREGRLAAWGIPGTGAILIAASGFGLDLGLPTCVSAMIAVLVTTRGSSRALGQIFKGVSWSVIPVAGSFVLVESLKPRRRAHTGVRIDSHPGVCVGSSSGIGVLVVQWHSGIRLHITVLQARFRFVNAIFPDGSNRVDNLAVA